VQGLPDILSADDASNRPNPSNDGSVSTLSPLLALPTTSLGSRAGRPRGARANDSDLVIRLATEFAEWVLDDVKDRLQPVQGPINVIPSAIPDWYLWAGSGSTAKGVEMRLEAARGLDPGLATLGVEVGSQVANTAIREVTRAHDENSSSDSILEVHDAASAVTLALLKALLDSGIRILQPGVEAVSKANGVQALIVHVSLSSLLWRMGRAERSASAMGGWLLLDASGIVEAAGMRQIGS